MKHYLVDTIARRIVSEHTSLYEAEVAQLNLNRKLRPHACSMPSIVLSAPREWIQGALDRSRARGWSRELLCAELRTLENDG